MKRPPVDRSAVLVIDEAAPEVAPFGERVRGIFAGFDGPLPSLRVARELFDRRYLEHALAQANGQVARAARLASRNRSDFYSLLRRHGLSHGKAEDGDA